MEEYRVTKQRFVHVGVNLGIVTKQIWFTRSIWKAKLQRIHNLILLKKDNPEIIALLKEEGCDENYSEDPTTNLSDHFEMIGAYTKWIEYCAATLHVWNQDNGGHVDHTRLDQRLARIVYQLFTLHTIWTEVEKHLISEATKSVKNVRHTFGTLKTPISFTKIGQNLKAVVNITKT
jgi:hypothetical protein